MKILGDLTKREVDRLLEYRPKTGAFTWKEASGRWGRIPAGTIAGSLNKGGYRYIRIGRAIYRACRLAWLITYGKWPDGQIDHINRDTGDDRIDNLRDVTQSENKKNCGIYCNNSSGYRGVSFDKSREKWVAHINLGNGKKKRIGRFNSAEDAAMALEVKKGESHG